MNDLLTTPVNTATEVQVQDTASQTSSVADEPSYKYDEDNILAEAFAYIKSTYTKHYVGKNDIQTIDVWDTLGSVDTTTRDTAIKYLMRYGKKGGYNKADLLKAIHYTVLLYYFTKDKK